MERTVYFAANYEPGPVNSLVEAVEAFVSAYNNMQDALYIGPKELVPFSDILRIAMYKPICIEKKPQISLYEIGVVRLPDSTSAGQLSVNKEKLGLELKVRENDIGVLFTQPIFGVLPRLCALLMPFKDHSFPEAIRMPALRLLNECRRLNVMWE